MGKRSKKATRTTAQLVAKGNIFFAIDPKTLEIVYVSDSGSLAHGFARGYGRLEAEDDRSIVVEATVRVPIPRRRTVPAEVRVVNRTRKAA